MEWKLSTLHAIVPSNLGRLCLRHLLLHFLLSLGFILLFSLLVDFTAAWAAMETPGDTHASTNAAGADRDKYVGRNETDVENYTDHKANDEADSHTGITTGFATRLGNSDPYQYGRVKDEYQGPPERAGCEFKDNEANFTADASLTLITRFNPFIHHFDSTAL